MGKERGSSTFNSEIAQERRGNQIKAGMASWAQPLSSTSHTRTLRLGQVACVRHGLLVELIKSAQEVVDESNRGCAAVVPPLLQSRPPGASSSSSSSEPASIIVTRDYLYPSVLVPSKGTPPFLFVSYTDVQPEMLCICMQRCLPQCCLPYKLATYSAKATIFSSCNLLPTNCTDTCAPS